MRFVWLLQHDCRWSVCDGVVLGLCHLNRGVALWLWPAGRSQVWLPHSNNRGFAHTLLTVHLHSKLWCWTLLGLLLGPWPCWGGFLAQLPCSCRQVVPGSWGTADCQGIWCLWSWWLLVCMEDRGMVCALVLASTGTSVATGREVTMGCRGALTPCYAPAFCTSCWGPGVMCWGSCVSWLSMHDMRRLKWVSMPYDDGNRMSMLP
jgi:hypothetical protein